MRRAFIFLILLFACSCITLSSIPSALAQSDWQANDPDLKTKQIERYQQIVDRSPEEGYAFVQMMQQVGKGAEYEKLLQNYEKKVNASPKNFNLRMILGHIHKYASNYPKALESYYEAAKIQENSLVFESIALIEEESKDLEAAEKNFEAALKLSKDKAQKERILRSLANLALYRRQNEKAQAHFDALLRLDPRSLFLRKEVAQLLLENKRYDEAYAQLVEAEKLAGSDTQAKIQIRMDMGSILEIQNKDVEALSFYRAESKKLPSQHWASNEIAHRIIDINRRRGSLEDSLKELSISWGKPSYDQLLTLSDLNDELGKYDEAEKLLQRAISLQPKAPEARLKQLALLRARADETAYNNAYQALIKTIPQNLDYRLNYADELFKKNKSVEALTLLRQARSAFKSSGDAQLRIADKLTEFQKTDEAILTLETRLKTAPNDYDTIEALGTLYALEGRHQEALKTWQLIEKTNLTKQEKREILARIYAENSLFSQAQSLHEQAIKEDPRNCDAKRSLADLHERSRRFNEALNEWESISKQCPQAALKREANRHIVAIYKSQGILGSKLEAFEREFQKNPNDKTNGFFLAYAFGEDDNPEGAIRVLESLEKAQPNDEDTLFSLAEVYAGQRMFSQAQNCLEKIINNQSAQRREAMLLIADYALLKGDPKLAEKWLLEALNLNANDAPNLTKLAQVYQKQGNDEKSIYYYEQARSVDPRAFENALELANLYILNGQYDEADKQYLDIILNSNDEAMILKAGMRTIDYNEFRKSLPDLEKKIYPITRKTPRKAAYDLSMLKICDAQAQGLILRLKSSEAHLRAQARFELRDLGQRFSKTIISALQSSDLGSRNLALKLTPYLAIPNAVNVLEQFMQDDNRNLQIDAILAIAFSQLPNAIPVLKKYTASHYDRRIREIATWGLGIIQSPAAENALLEILELNIDSLRALAAIGLGRQGKNPETLFNILKNDPSNAVKLAAAWALGNIAYNDAATEILKLYETVPNAAMIALWAVSRLNHPQATKTIFDALWSSKENHAALRGIAAKIIRNKTKHQSSIELTQWEHNRSFISSMKDQNRSIYLNALDYPALLQAFVEESLLNLLPSPDTFLLNNYDAASEAASKAVKSNHRDATIAVLQDLNAQPGPARFDKLNAEADTLRTKIAKSIDPQLTHLLQSSDLGIQLLAIKLAAMNQTPVHLPAILKIYEDSKNPMIKAESIRALAAFKTETAEKKLLSLTKDAHYLVRYAAVDALITSQNPKAENILIQALKDPFPHVACRAAEGLAMINNESSKTALVGAFEIADSTLQLAIIKALHRMGAVSEISSLKTSHPMVLAEIKTITKKGND